MNDKLVFAADIGGTTVKLGLFRADGALLDKWEIPTRTEQDGKYILPDVAASIREKMTREAIAPEQVSGIGIGIPGPVDENCVAIHGCDNLGWGRVPVKGDMNALLPEVPNVVVGNDANVAALGEAWLGSGKGYRNSVLFTLGTGVGGGVIIDGRIVPGRNGAAGELGHMLVNPNETIPCGCGKCGCLEQYASATGMARLAREALVACDTPSPLRELDKITAKDVCDHARNGDGLANEILDRFADYLARGMSFASCTVDPEVIMVGGGVSRAGDTLLNPVRRYFRKYAYHPCVDTPIAAAKLGNDAGIYGCAAMVLGI
ncbi:MAG: ROK family glucokinase [Oscillospiraceae bacterium]|nr:ROK family glucokinase [Oscillospiraceae bacterium]